MSAPAQPQQCRCHQGTSQNQSSVPIFVMFNGNDNNCNCSFFLWQYFRFFSDIWIKAESFLKLVYCDFKFRACCSHQALNKNDTIFFQTIIFGLNVARWNHEFFCGPNINICGHIWIYLMFHTLINRGPTHRALE